MSLGPLAAAASIVTAIAAADDADEAMERALAELDRRLGIEHTLLLLLDEAGTGLFTVKARGYPQGGAGAEVAVGVGIIGTVAKSRVPFRHDLLGQALRYHRTSRIEAVLAGAAVGREIPLPGLHDVASVLAVPLLLRGQLVGVLSAESARPRAFDDAIEQAVTIVAAALAAQLALLGALSESDAPPARGVPAPAAAGPIREVRFFLADDSVFVGHEYVIKGVAGRILVKLLREHAAGRREFTNRELRLDRWLQLPPIHDNLENRLLLLRQRLEEGDFGVRIARTGRGRFEVHVAFTPRLSEHA